VAARAHGGGFRSAQDASERGNTAQARGVARRGGRGEAAEQWRVGRGTWRHAVGLDCPQCYPVSATGRYISSIGGKFWLQRYWGTGCQGCNSDSLFSPDERRMVRGRRNNLVPSREEKETSEAPAVPLRPAAR
jgi:hypothetical protein